jgi:tetratricopeptide (TPR) repeat protein
VSQLYRRNSHRAIPYLAVAVASALFADGPALAASKANKQAQENAARTACLDGDYTQGVAILSKLFVQYNKDLTYIFNQGRCFEQSRRYEDAVARFQEYLRAGRNKIDANDKAEAEQHITDCKEMIAQERGTSPPPGAAQSAVAAPSKPEPAPTPEPAATVTQPAPQAVATSSGAGLRIGGIVVASFGVAAAGAGILFNVMANSTVSDMYKTSDGYTKESDRKTYATLAWVGYGVGAASVVTGAILYGVGLKAKSSHSGDVALVPMMGPDRAGAVLTGAF